MRGSVWMMSAAAVLALVATTTTSWAADNADESGWKSLLAGDEIGPNWTTKGNWSFEDGVATLTPREGEKDWTRWNMYLWSTSRYTDFEIKFEILNDKRGNSGFYFRVGDVGNPVSTGIEVQIFDSGSQPADHKLNDHDAGGIIPGIAPTKNAANPTGQWNRYHVKVQNDKLTVKVNDQVVNEVDLSKQPLNSRPKTGYIGFQDHGISGGKFLKVRNVKIRELAAN